MTYYCGGCERPYDSPINASSETRSTCPRCNPSKTSNVPLPYCSACKCVKDGDGCGCNPEGA